MGKRLRIVPERSATYPDPPASLGEPGRNLWRRVLDEYDISDVAGLLTLETAARAFDRAESLREVIQRDGLTISTPNGVKEHPLLRHEIQARSLLLRALARLGINHEPLKPLGRPPSPVGWRPER